MIHARWGAFRTFARIRATIAGQHREGITAADGEPVRFVVAPWPNGEAPA